MVIILFDYILRLLICLYEYNAFASSAIDGRVTSHPFTCLQEGIVGRYSCGSAIFIDSIVIECNERNWVLLHN